ncbi:hypothetical protein R1flu_014871 [Riccia fluitans]|uniref:Uncharacterized protein n=1 Tax=Riccia fluitans TaxID=41844 RepID=A0ABD1YHP5_9MARC
MDEIVSAAADQPDVARSAEEWMGRFERMNNREPRETATRGTFPTSMPQSRMKTSRSRSVRLAERRTAMHEVAGALISACGTASDPVDGIIKQASTESD